MDLFISNLFGFIWIFTTKGEKHMITDEEIRDYLKRPGHTIWRPEEKPKPNQVVHLIELPDGRKFYAEISDSLEYINIWETNN